MFEDEDAQRWRCTGNRQALKDTQFPSSHSDTIHADWTRGYACVVHGLRIYTPKFARYVINAWSRGCRLLGCARVFAPLESKMHRPHLQEIK